MLTELDVTGVSPGAANCSVRTPVAPVIDRLVNAATPLEFVTAESVPPSEPPPDAIDAVTLTPAVPTGLFEESCNCTAGCGENTALFAAVAGG
jgi:hypothetical protein